MYPYGLIGNCQASALVHRSGSIDWLCFPRPDSPPIFGKLLDPQGGEFSFETPEPAESTQSYLPNSNVLVTEVRTNGGDFRIIDFCPRYEQYGRIYRPNMLIRIVEPVRGNPMVRVRCRVIDGWEKNTVRAVRGNTHLRWEVRGDSLRLTTNMSLTHLCDEVPTRLAEPLFFVLSWSFAVEEDLKTLAYDSLAKTDEYWRRWVKHCSIPALFQEETIRSALALKLHCYEDTGAIMAALTTSLPEEVGNVRNWDYRYCWLRDTYFTLSAFHNLGHFEEMEGFLRYLLGIVHTPERIRPVYRIDQTLPLPEIDYTTWTGFGGSQPVRCGNDAANHVQNDAFGEMVLALCPIFFDERFRHLRTREHERLVELLARLCSESIGVPDAGLWELRNGWQDHSFTNLMCWAGLDRVAALQSRGYFRGVDFDVAEARARAEAAVRRAVADGSVRNGPTDSSFNAALLQLPILRFPDQELCARTVEATARALRFSDDEFGRLFLFRYRRDDDFGAPRSAFVFCSYWWVQALAKVGHVDEARRMLEQLGKTANEQGLLAEHFEPGEYKQLGNFPQAYSHVGQINAAFAVSPPWSEVL